MPAGLIDVQLFGGPHDGLRVHVTTDCKAISLDTMDRYGRVIAQETYALEVTDQGKFQLRHIGTKGSE